MSPAAERLLHSALALPEAEQLELAEALLEAAHPPAPDLTGAAWLAELNRRSDELDAGGVEVMTWDEAKRRARTRGRAFVPGVAGNPQGVALG